MFKEFRNHMASRVLADAGVQFSDFEDGEDIKVPFKNTVSVKNVIETSIEKSAPKDAKQYWIFKPKIIRKTLKSIRKEEVSGPREFIEKYATQILTPSPKSLEYNFDRKPISYAVRYKRVLDRTEKKTCGKCGGRKEYSVNQTTQVAGPMCTHCMRLGRIKVMGIDNSMTTNRGKPILLRYETCLYCLGRGYLLVDQHITKVVSCQRCSGQGYTGKKFYRTDKVFSSDFIRSQFKRKTEVKWPKILQRLISFKLLNEEEVLNAGLISDEKIDKSRKGLTWDYELRFKTVRSVVSYNGKETEATIIETNSDPILISSTPLLNPYFDELRKMVGKCSKTSLQDLKDKNEIVGYLFDFDPKNGSIDKLTADFGFLVSPRRIKKMRKKIAWVQRRKKVYIITIITLPLLGGAVMFAPTYLPYLKSLF